MTPLLTMFVQPVTGSDVYGQPMLGTRRLARCAIVRLELAVSNTATRSDAGASQGHALEAVAVAVILVTPSEPVREGDKVELMGHKLRVARRIPRHRATGQLDHYELHLALWGG